MRKNHPCTRHEHCMRDGSILVSKTNLKGVITYVNKDFCEISGFTREELLGQAHNIIRHPDMPQEAFQTLWDDVQQGKPWTGLVKNRCKNGDYYWVKANVIPITHNGVVTEYMSVRTKPTRDEVEAAEQLYQQVNQQQVSLKPTGIKRLLVEFNRQGICTRVTQGITLISACLLTLLGMAYYQVETSNLMLMIGFTALAILFCGWRLVRCVMNSLNASIATMEQMVEGNYFHWINFDLRGKLGHLQRMMFITQVKMGFDVIDAREQGYSNQRITTALNRVNVSVVMADANHNITYMNQSARQMFNEYESYIRQDFPRFSANHLEGGSLTQFYRDAGRHRQLLDGLKRSHQDEVEFGGLRTRLVFTPVYDNGSDERLGTVVEWSILADEQTIEEEINEIVAWAQEGDLSHRFKTENKDGFFLALGQRINQLLDTVDDVFMNLKTTLNRLDKGDLTQTMHGEYHGVFEQVQQSINSTINVLRNTVNSIHGVADTVSTSSEEILQGNMNLSERSGQQASALEQTAKRLEGQASVVTKNAESAAIASNLAGETLQSAEQGGEVVERAIQAMNAIDESSSQIAEIIATINEIAFQTNLLALNASVEAARAGDQGRGFAVVASEVRNLALRASTAADEIKNLIQDSVSKVSAGSSLVNQSGETLSGIIDGVKQVSELIQAIDKGSDEQSHGIKDIMEAVNTLDKMTQQNASLAQSALKTSQSLQERTHKMGQVISFFKLQ